MAAAAPQPSRTSRQVGPEATRLLLQRRVQAGLHERSSGRTIPCAPTGGGRGRQLLAAAQVARDGSSSWGTVVSREQLLDAQRADGLCRRVSQWLAEQVSADTGTFDGRHDSYMLGEDGILFRYILQADDDDGTSPFRVVVPRKLHYDAFPWEVLQQEGSPSDTVLARRRWTLTPFPARSHFGDVHEAVGSHLDCGLARKTGWLGVTFEMELPAQPCLWRKPVKGTAPLPWTNLRRETPLRSPNSAVRR
ncbi:uncharacterized protein LOC135378485 [Ornithodoros turicata]|uniref:uncharacterized protein LOC135378485 n=1 Tax=Ornithodoros turicata TaxID=34597 RepID=UPI003138A628